MQYVANNLKYLINVNKGWRIYLLLLFIIRIKKETKPNDIGSKVSSSLVLKVIHFSFETKKIKIKNKSMHSKNADDTLH